MRSTLITLMLSLLLGMSVTVCTAQEIKSIKELPATSVKNQANSGTCWSFATVSFLESELLRKGAGEYDLSEIFFVHAAYPVKAERYVRLQGHNNFGGGGQAHDVLNVWISKGALPEEAYTGLVGDAKMHDQLEMDAILSGYMKTVVDPGISPPDKKWRAAIDSILNIYIGKVPERFEYNKKNYTSTTFAETLPINPDDYIELTSFTHHPFYGTFVLEVPDNWSAGSYYNVPLDELIEVMKYSIEQGYTFVWDGDVSGDVSFGANEGIAKLDNEKRTVDQETRQEGFDNFITTDDHLMHITGMGEDDKGNTYFLTKNSWGDARGINGYWWMSENYVRLNTIAIMVHRNAIPEGIANKLKLK